MISEKTKIFSPILDQLGMTGVFIDTIASWITVGKEEWKCMSDNFYALPYDQKIVGLDLEWYIIGDEVVCALKNFLEQEDMVICGVGVSSDAEKMLKDTGIRLENTMDLEHYAELYFNVGFGHHSLKSLGYDVAGFDMPIKTKSMARSDWSAPLNHLHRRYAAEDAAISFAVGKKIVERVLENDSMHFDNSVFSSKNNSSDPQTSPLIQWLQSTSIFAKRNFSRVCSLTIKMRNAKSIEEGNQIQKDGDNSTENLKRKHNKALSSSVTTLTSYPITILNEDMNFLFECSDIQGLYFVEHHSLSEVVTFYPNTSRPKTIKLKFDARKKSRLCVFHIFLLPCAPQCSFAHGVEDLDPESQKLLEDDTVEKCSICAGIGKLVKQSIVPPVFRGCLPSTLHHPLKYGGVLVCPQCQPMITFYMQEEIKRIENAAASLNPVLRRDRQKCVGRCVSLSRLLHNTEKRKALPEGKTMEFLDFVFKTWEEFDLESFSSFCTPSNDEKVEENEIVQEKKDDDEWMLTASRLKKIVNFNTGDYRAQLLMNTLVGDDLQKGKLFVDGWWDFMVKKCHILDKVHPHICNKGKKADKQLTKCSTLEFDEVKEKSEEVHNSSRIESVQESE